MSVDEETRCEDIKEALTHLVTSAKRCFQVVGTKELPTLWDRAHERIDELLDAYEAQRDKEEA